MHETQHMKHEEKKKRGFILTSERERGFTLMLAALVSSIVLALGTSIYEIAQKEVQLSALGRDSQFAFYAADTAAECALYWDFRYSYFATSSP
jgi:Tfp pilus assembly protein PilX